MVSLESILTWNGGIIMWKIQSAVVFVKTSTNMSEGYVLKCLWVLTFVLLICIF